MSELPPKKRWLIDRGGYPAPDWQWLYDWVHEKPDDVQDDLAVQVTDAWVDALRDRLGDPYEVIASGNFLVVSGQPKRQSDILVTSMERALDRIGRQLKDIIAVRHGPKDVTILFRDVESYLEYTSVFYRDDGEYGYSGGIFVPDGFGHVVLPSGEIHGLESTITHELTHAVVSHLDLPQWLDEALAMRMEIVAGLRGEKLVDEEAVVEHQQFWTGQRLEDFWSGASFYTPEGQHLSYGLAEVLLTVLSDHTEGLREFVRHARRDDGGRAAAREFLEADLDQYVRRFLGRVEEDA